MDDLQKLYSFMECECGRRFTYEALYRCNEINFCSKCGRKKPKYLNEEFANLLLKVKLNKSASEEEKIIQNMKKEEEYIEKLKSMLSQ